MDPNDPPDTPSRRAVVGAASASLAVSSLSALAQSSSNQSGGAPTAAGQGTLQNPVTEYPKPPFRQQRQDPPGLASRMDPRPDHGEATYRGSGKLAGRKALITGSDSGIGRAAAIAFAREGADVALNYLPVEEPDAREVVELIRGAGRKAVPLPGDIRDEAFCRQLVDNAAQQLGGLDILVNNAAKQTAQRSIEDITTEQFDATFKTNVFAMFWITKAALQHLPAGAAIINTASVEAFNPSELLLDYAQTKASIVAFTKALAKQLAQKGIRVNAVAPGPFWTPLQPSGGQTPEGLVQFGGDTPIGRPGQPAELAATYVLLASPEASYMTGEVVSNTGGRMPV